MSMLSSEEFTVPFVKVEFEWGGRLEGTEAGGPLGSGWGWGG
jgi:hypothetical protein